MYLSIVWIFASTQACEQGALWNVQGYIPDDERAVWLRLSAEPGLDVNGECWWKRNTPRFKPKPCFLISSAVINNDYMLHWSPLCDAKLTVSGSTPADMPQACCLTSDDRVTIKTWAYSIVWTLSLGQMLYHIGICWVWMLCLYHTGVLHVLCSYMRLWEAHWSSSFVSMLLRSFQVITCHRWRQRRCHKRWEERQAVRRREQAWRQSKQISKRF